MNIHVIVEGEVGEKLVYKNWIPLINSSLSFVEHISEIESNNFSIIAGRGYPNYFNVIENAILDVNEYCVDRLVIVADSEDMDCEEKYKEINKFIQSRNVVCRAQIFIVIQHFCLETWALGNRRAGPKNPRTYDMMRYKAYYDVWQDDPALMEPPEEEELNRAQFAEKYLRCMLLDKQTHCTYSKRNPTVLCNKQYFNEVKKRYESTHHISSFRSFMTAFT